MSTSYTIIFDNKRPVNGQYDLFAEPPELSSAAISNVWMSFFVPVGGSFTVSTAGYYAWVGTTPITPASGTTISTSDSLPATLGQGNVGGSTFHMKIKQGTNYLDESEATLDAPVGAFQIITGTDFQVPNTTYLVGIGHINQFGQVVPTATVFPGPNETLNIFPVPIFYILESSGTPGSVVDISGTSNGAAVIDFTSSLATGKFTAIVSHNLDGDYKVKYTDSTIAGSILKTRPTKEEIHRPKEACKGSA